MIFLFINLRFMCKEFCRQIHLLKHEIFHISYIVYSLLNELSILQTGSATYKLELFAVPSGERLVVKAADYAPSSSNGAGESVDPSHVVWSSWTSVLGPEMEGVWPTADRAQQVDVNCADVCKNSAAVVTGDDFGFVKLFRFPALEANVHDFYL